MAVRICATCGTEHPDARQPPASCAMCLDLRRHVRPGGQRWETRDELAAGHRNGLGEQEPDLAGSGTHPSSAIGQRALLVATPAGNVAWDCNSSLDGDLS